MAQQVEVKVPDIGDFKDVAVIEVLVKPGDTVRPGDVLFILEVMKTEVPHEASQAGTVQSVNIHEGQEGVDAGIVAVMIA